MRRAAVVLLAMLAAAPVTFPAQAQEGEGEPVEACTPANAERVTIAQLEADFRQLAGRCITVYGLHAFGRYATQNGFYPDAEAALRGAHMLVINYHNEADEHARHPPRWEEVTGRFGSCVLQYEWLYAEMERNPNILPMLGGLCHYTLDAHYIVPVVYAPAGGPPVTRLRLEDTSAEERAFEPVDITENSEFAGRTTFEQLLHILSFRNFEDYIRLHDPVRAEELEDLTPLDLDPHELDELADMTLRFENARDTWRGFAGDRDPRLFVLRSVAADENEDGTVSVHIEDLEEESDRTFCVLREGQEIDAFPVRWADIDNQPSRPYFCARVMDAISRSGEPPRIEVPYAVTGFPEAAE
ncbi:hypothetical protein [Aurantiacibacter gilvus]|uniref:Phospholipase C/D domain-containing protein n=1 Tax=Aurantiacibacter gilvus TaxID=3139141 RepID=A0ABU9IEZ9_9SPHN